MRIQFEQLSSKAQIGSMTTFEENDSLRALVNALRQVRHKTKPTTAAQHITQEI